MNDKKSQAQLLAEEVGKSMFESDLASQGLGITLREIRPGYAVMEMKVRPEMLNGYAICHGGFIFALADSAFAFACNSYNEITLASGVSIDFLAPAQLGDTLSAEAAEQSKGRSSVYDVRVSNGDSKLIALFRGRSRRIKGLIVPDSKYYSGDQS